MSSVTNNNTENTPSFNGAGAPSAPSWGQAGCGSVGYSYAAIIEAMNALQSLVALSADQANLQAQIGADIAKNNAEAIIAQAQDTAWATRAQAIGQMAAGAAAIASVGMSCWQTGSDANEADNFTAQQKTFENLQTQLPQNPSGSPGGSSSNSTNPTNDKPQDYVNWSDGQKTLYDTLTQPNATPKQINDALKDLGTGDIETVAKSINTPAASQTANENLSKAVASCSNNARIYTDKVNTNTQKWNTISTTAQSFSNGIASIFQADKQAEAGQEGANNAVLQNAQQINNNQLQTSISYIGKAYDAELTSLQMLATLAQASHV